MLIKNLFDNDWEKRHGGATGLRELLRLHGADAGRGQEQTAQQVSTKPHWGGGWSDDI